MTDKEIDKTIRDEIKQDFKAREEKHKQIEEMAKVILSGTGKYCELVLGSEKDKTIHYEKFLAEELYNADYRKVGEEYEYIKGYLPYTKQLKKQVHKETAKEIFNKLIKIAEDEFKGSLPFGVLKAWALEYKVEVNKNDR